MEPMAGLMRSTPCTAHEAASKSVASSQFSVSKRNNFSAGKTQYSAKPPSTEIKVSSPLQQDQQNQRLTMQTMCCKILTVQWLPLPTVMAVPTKLSIISRDFITDLEPLNLTSHFDN